MRLFRLPGLFMILFIFGNGGDNVGKKWKKHAGGHYTSGDFARDSRKKRR